MRIEDINTEKFTELIAHENTTIIIIKFSAEWCKPCRIVAPIFEQYIINHSKRNDVIIGVVDIDSSDFYRELKRKRMINGIPCIMAFYRKNGNDNNNYLIPDDSITGANIKDVSIFLNRCDTYILKSVKEISQNKLII